MLSGRLFILKLILDMFALQHGIDNAGSAVDPEAAR